jgi:hypothetical protein
MHSGAMGTTKRAQRSAALLAVHVLCHSVRAMCGRGVLSPRAVMGASTRSAGACMCMCVYMLMCVSVRV